METEHSAQKKDPTPSDASSPLKKAVGVCCSLVSLALLIRAFFLVPDSLFNPAFFESPDFYWVLILPLFSLIFLFKGRALFYGLSRGSKMVQDITIVFVALLTVFAWWFLQ
jgi:VIT1/CCC1 family predicted Fe2+/Mn2+ transporter